MRRIPLHDDSAPIVCTIGAAEVPQRVALVARLRGSLTSVARTEHGIVLRFPLDAEVDADVRRFAVEEKRCCTFWGFAVEADDAGTSLRWDGPSAAAPILDGLHAYFDGEGSLSDLAGLL